MAVEETAEVVFEVVEQTVVQVVFEAVEQTVAGAVEASG